MINALHLLWIIPLSGVTGFFAAAICAASGKEERQHGNDFERKRKKRTDEE
ncbi:MAG: hypothetical protein IKL57_07760 [Oscillospiraceae bacterium]|nr:hypothetical protein [Oscillospiraceae bacterium]